MIWIKVVINQKSCKEWQSWLVSKVTPVDGTCFFKPQHLTQWRLGDAAAILIILKLISTIDIFGISCKIALK